MLYEHIPSKAAEENLLMLCSVYNKKIIRKKNGLPKGRPFNATIGGSYEIANTVFCLINDAYSAFIWLAIISACGPIIT